MILLNHGLDGLLVAWVFGNVEAVVGGRVEDVDGLPGLLPLLLVPEDQVDPEGKVLPDMVGLQQLRI